METKTCSKCGLEKNREDYYGRSHSCKECVKARVKANTDPTKRKIYMDEYCKNKYEEIIKPNLQARRARKAGNGGRYTSAEWKALVAATGTKCLRCGATDYKLTVDHVVPLVNGGRNDIDNIQPLCLACNLSKNARTADYRGKDDAAIARLEATLAPLRGRKKSPISDETKEKISKTLTGFRHGEESRKNMAIGVKDSWTRRGARSDSSSGVRGVCWDSEQRKWRVKATLNGKRVSLGRFDTINEASEALERCRNEQSCI